MSDWGDDLERRHFDGNFLNAVSTAPATTTARIGEELGSTLTRKVGEHTPTATELGSTLTRATELGSTLTRRVGEQATGLGSSLTRATELGSTLTRATELGSTLTRKVGEHARIGGELGSTLTRRVGEQATELGSTLTRKVGEQATLIGELGTVAAKLIDEAAARDPGGGAPCGIVLGSAAAAPSLAATSQNMGPDAYSCGQAWQPDGAEEPAASDDGHAAEASLLEEVQQLQAQLARERDLRQMRTLTVSALDEAVRGLRADIGERRRAMEQADEDRLVAQDKVCRVERCLETLQEQHSALLKRRAAQEVDLRRHAVAAFASEKAARELRREGGWAREGPETEALKDAKVALAEVLAELDEVQLQARRETAALRKEYEAAQAESEQLRHAAQQDTAPRSLRRSVWRLLSRGGGESEHRSA